MMIAYSLVAWAAVLAFIGPTHVSGYGTELDVSWDFTDSYEGWANATYEEMQMETRIEGGELRAAITGDSPHMDSPMLLIDTIKRHFCVIRMMYFGGNTKGSLMLRSSGGLADTVQMDHGTQYWGDRLPVLAFSDSGSLANHSRSALVDNDPYTYWASNTASAAFVILDLGDTRWITQLKIITLGDSSSPKSCLLQRSITLGIGPFETVTNFVLMNNTLETQSFGGFDGHARYWRVLFLDNYGGSSISVRELELHGVDESTVFLPFDLDNSGKYKNYYLPMHRYMSGPLVRMRLQIGNDASVKVQPTATQKHVQKGKTYREGLAIDYIRIVKSPEIWRVRGCLDKYYDSVNLDDPVYNVTKVVHMLNDKLPIYSSIKNEVKAKQYATTYDCPLKGGVNITLQGLYFGRNARVFIGGKECLVQEYIYDPVAGEKLETLVCKIPASTTPGPAVMRVQNGILPGLFQEKDNVFLYRNAPPVPKKPIPTNIGATRVDLVWEPPGTEFDHLAVTGYKIIWFQPQFRSRVSNMTVTNVTTTSVRGLQPGTEYVFAIAAISEGAFHEKAAHLPTDLYGRRDINGEDAYMGTFSDFTNITATLFYDFDFSFFSANATLNASSVKSTKNTDGPTGMYGGEGNYGLVMVGSANVQNCNASSTCCDGYNPLGGVTSCGVLPTVCAVLLADQLAYPFVEGGVTRRQVPSNLPYSNGARPEKVVLTVEELKENKGAEMPNSACGPALRLTPSGARESGSVWYKRQVNVGEGFDTTFAFEISNPSQICDSLDDVSTYCRSRGADGLAFVIQGISPVALGNAGSGIGYEGIMNSIAVEIDTYFNYDQMDFYENHVAVMTQGWRFNNSANHSYALATSTRVPDLTDGVHTVRIKYDPNFVENAVLHPSFQINGYTSWFLQNADYSYGGTGDWGTGFGLLYVYVDDLYSPIITTPLNLDSTLQLQDGRMYIGITAATGDNHWQAHDLLSWQFKSLYIDKKYHPPLIINGEGDYQCANMSACVHHPDYLHYLRENKVSGSGYDNVEGWQTGREGFCATC